MLSSMLSMVMLLGSVLMPARMWYAPDMPLNVQVKSAGDASLVLTEFTGRKLEPSISPDVKADQTVDVRQMFPQVNTPGTYVLFVTKRGAADTKEFEGTPLVIEVRENRKRGAPPGPMVIKVEPLRYAVMSTPKGSMTMLFYYDVAPNTVTSFLTLAEQGYFDGLTFHRILPDFVLQGGDPKGDGTGSPGFSVDAEFNDRPHEAGALSMARTGDPSEGPGVMPRSEFANSAGSQFFICLNYDNTRSLDNKYTVFGKVVDGMDTAKKIAATPLADERAGTPREKQVIEKVEVKHVTARENPYLAITKGNEVVAPPTQPPKSKP